MPRESFRKGRSDGGAVAARAIQGQEEIRRQLERSSTERCRTETITRRVVGFDRQHSPLRRRDACKLCDGHIGVFDVLKHRDGIDGIERAILEGQTAGICSRKSDALVVRERFLPRRRDF